ncbi:MAG: cyclic nucleotide-binding domain-containing protein [Chloroflexi bacterium]|nr:cyclic nucleotide-binding domain-containing protein [Chloroflexota bacterium]
MTHHRLTATQLDQLLAAYTSDADSSAVIDSGIIRLLPPGLRQMTTPVGFDAGEVIFYQGEAGDAMYLIRSGGVAVIRGTFDAPLILGYRDAGEFVGEMALIDDLPRSATVVAVQPVQLLKIVRDDFQQLLAESTLLDHNLLRKLSARLRASDDERSASVAAQQRLTQHVVELEFANKHLLEVQRLQQETVDLIVHDLRSPLHVIVNALGVLTMSVPDDVLRANAELFNLAAHNTDRMIRLIDSMLDVSRLEAGQLVLETAPTDLASLVQTVTQRVGHLFAKHQLTLAVEIPDLPDLLIDADMIDRVLANLLDNAIKFTPNYGQIRVSAAQHADHILVRVADTGRGIPPAQRHRFFDRFVQAAGDQPRVRGFGLGLTFCRLAIEAHGGQIWIEDGADGVGSQFVFSLPLMKRVCS